MRRFFVFLYLLSWSFSAFCLNHKELGISESGFLDYSHIQFSNSSSVPLQGEVKFFRNRLLNPNLNDLSGYTFDLVNLNSSWRNNGASLGFGTYFFTLKLPSISPELSIFFPLILSSSKIWVNGSLTTETGVVATTSLNHQPELREVVLKIPSDVSTLEIVIQVANFSYFKGGIAKSPSIWKSDDLMAHIKVVNGLQTFFIGSLFAMFLYQLLLFSQHQVDRSYLWLSIICLIIALRAAITSGGSLFMHELLPNVNAKVWWRVEFFGVYSLIFFIPKYINSLFTQYKSLFVLKFFMLLAVFLCVTVLITPQYIYGALLDFFHVCLVIVLGYTVYITAKAYRDGNFEAKIIFFGVVLALPFFMAEIAINSLWLNLNFDFPFFVELGMLVFLFFQVLLLVKRYVASYNSLQALNFKLETTVKKRTKELLNSNRIKDMLISIISHDIKAPLNSLKGLIAALSARYITQEEFSNLLKDVDQQLENTSKLLDSLLHWKALQLDNQAISIVPLDMKAVIDENIELFRLAAKRKGVRITSEVQDTEVVFSDRNVLNIVVRNLISNALKFTPSAGNILIRYQKKSDYMVIEVIDDGKGMDAGTVDSILSKRKSIVRNGTDGEKGSGLGLMFCKYYLEKLNGELKIESEIGSGSNFKVEIKLENEDAALITSH